MFQEQGQGAFGPGFSTPRQDRRVLDLILDNLGDGFNRTDYKTPSDPLRNFVLQKQNFGGDTPLTIGNVVYSYPMLNWYRVQMSRGGGSIPCCFGAHADTGPLGVRSGGGIAPYSFVVVYKPADVEWGIILCVMPPLMCDPKILVPGWVQQGSQSGAKREEAYKEPQKMLYKDGGIQDFGSMSPADATPYDKNLLAETGVGWHVDPAMAFLRASEMCGLWVTIWDHYARLAAMNFDLSTVALHLLSRHDEGELRYEERAALYPWEATGQYSRAPFGREWDDKDVQFKKPVGKWDLTEEERKLLPIFRSTRYGGYLGQGWMRQVVKPAKDSGQRLYTDETPGDVGLFRESIGADGAAMWESAKSLFLVKRPRIVVPKEVKPPEHKDGDDKEAGNYKFSSEFGGGEDHKVGDIEVEGEAKSMLRVAAVFDVLSHHWNWKALHPFHYHKKDYKTEQESETQKFDAVAEQLNYSPLADGDVLADPTPKRVKIDHRYNEVDYYQRCAFLAFFDDGSVALCSGCGGQLVLAGGNASLECAGEARIRPGTRALVMSRDVVVRGQQSVDVSSSEKEVRIAAHKKVQILGQSVLLHGKGKSKQYEYRNKIGEDVRSAGVLIKTNSDFVVLADDVYVRSGIPKDAGAGYATDGGGGGSGGDIVLDAKKKGKDVILRGKNVTALVEDALAVWHGPEGQATETHNFRDTIAVHSTSLIVRGQIVGCGKSGLLIDGSVAATGSIACARYMAHKKGPFVGTVPGSFAGQIKQACDKAKAAVEALIPIGATIENLMVKQKWTEPANRPGNDDLIKDLQFSFRDDEGGRQYKASSVRFFEARWEALARLGMASGVAPWVEEPLDYQGRQLRAYPGQEKWTAGDVFHRAGDHTMFDVGTGNSKARPGPYEEAKLSEWDRTSIESGAKIVQ